MSDIEQDLGDVQPAPTSTATRRRPQRHEDHATLSEIRHTLGADHVAAVRRCRGRHAFEVVATAGPGYVSAGVALPLETSDLLGVALAGHVGALELCHSEAPLEALAFASGLSTAVAVPARGLPGRIAGAIMVAWRELAASAEAVDWAVGRERGALAELLALPSAWSARH